MLTEQHLKKIWLGLIGLALALVLLISWEYHALCAQTAQVVNLHAQYQILNSQLTQVLAQQTVKLQQLELAEKKSGYA